MILVLVPMKKNQNVFLKGHFLITLQKMQRPGVEIVVDSRGDGDNGIRSLEERSRHVGDVMNSLIDDYLKPYHSHVLMMDSDLDEFPEDLPFQLMDTAKGKAIVAPMVLSAWGYPRYYDVAGFVENGKWARMWPPYFDQKERIIELDSVGCCYMVPADILKGGARLEYVQGFTQHYGLCKKAKEMGFKVKCDTGLKVRHADLTKYGEQIHGLPSDRGNK